jgi:hypothetical protein
LSGAGQDFADLGWRALGAVSAGVAGSVVMMRQLWRWNKDFDDKQVAELARKDKTIERQTTLIESQASELRHLREENWLLKHPG